MRETRHVCEKTRGYISAKFLLAELPQGYVIPLGFKVTMCPVKVLHGARKPKGGAMLGATCPRSVWK